MASSAHPSERLANAALVAAIRSVMRCNSAVAAEDPSAAKVIQDLRDRGNHAYANALEKVVEKVRARRARRQVSGRAPP